MTLPLLATAAYYAAQSLAEEALVRLIVVDDEPKPVEEDPVEPRVKCHSVYAEIEADDLRLDLVRFEKIAQLHDNNRAAGRSGYDASVSFVQEELSKAGMRSWLSRFEIPDFHMLGPGKLAVLSEPTSVLTDKEFVIMRASPPGDVSAALVAVDLKLGPGNNSTSGCEEEDFDDVTGKIVLLQRGGCDFVDKVGHAEAAGAVGVVIFNQGNHNKRMGLIKARLISSEDDDHGLTIPVAFTTHASGANLAARLKDTKVEFRLHADTRYQMVQSMSVIAEHSGDSDEIFMLGAHLDSVPEGPGINDNASGSVGLLSIARALSRCESSRTVRFAWWGGEELGLLGSNHYVENLSEADKEDYLAYVNLDMIGSPNFAYQAGDGDGSVTKKPGPRASGELEAFFIADFKKRDLPLLQTRFLFRSDYTAFYDASIGVADVSTGYDAKKTAAHAKLFGGTVGKPYDPCYHEACDDLDNVDIGAMKTVTHAMARAVEHFALNGNGLTETE